MRRILCFIAALSVAACLWAASPPNDFRFAIIGDRTGGPRQEVYAQVWSEVESYNPDFAINVGDTIQGTDDETVAAQWEEIRAFLDKHKRFPFYMVPGNHDIWSSYSQLLFEKQAGQKLPYSFDYQNAHFVVLDNSRDPLFGDAAMRFLEEDLRRSRERSPKFVFFHQSFWILFLKAGNRAFPLHTLAKEHGVDYAISGHGHQLVRMVEDGVTYLEVGSSGANIGEVWRKEENVAHGAFYHHVRVEVKGSQAKFTIKEAGAPFGKGRSFDASTWGGNKR